MTSDRQRNYYQARSRSTVLPEVDRIWQWVGRNAAGMGIVRSDRGDTRLGIVSGNAAIAVGRPVLYIPPASGQPFGAIQLPTVLGEPPIIRATPPTGFWVFGGYEGTGLVAQNVRNRFEFTWSTAPQTLLDSFSVDIEPFPGAGFTVYTENYRTYHTNFLFAQALVLEEETAVTCTGRMDVDSETSSLTRIAVDWKAYEISSLIGLTTTNQIISDCLTAYYEGRLFTGFDTSNGATIESPWNQDNLITSIGSTIGEPSPLYGIQSLQALDTSVIQEEEGSATTNLPPGTWLIIGVQWRERIAALYEYTNVAPGSESVLALNPALLAEDLEATAVNNLYASISLAPA